jgi:hypothetical protein
MLGHRGCRLGISYPEIYEMQARAIFEAPSRRQKKAGAAVVPEIMIPLVGDQEGARPVKARIDAVAAKAVIAETGMKIDLSRRHDDRAAARRAARRRHRRDGEFFSFGTNDLTQTTFGISRDDAGASWTAYVRRASSSSDPFVSLDIDGVGELIEIAAERGRARARHQARHLRRAWRRPGLDPLLRGSRPRLRVLLALPRADRAAGGGAGVGGDPGRPCHQGRPDRRARAWSNIWSIRCCSFEGERGHQFRILRAVKNRFGPAPMRSACSR